MKKLLLLLLLAPVIGFGQGEQRYADGTATDQDGNTFEWINYGDLDWAIENANVTTYTDGTEIPNKTDIYDFWKLERYGAWIYFNNEYSSNGKLYNWYAIMGIHDNNPSTPNKEFAPEGWRIPSNEDWENLLDYLYNNGYHIDEGLPEDDPDYTINLSKAMSSTTGWENSNFVLSPGNNPNTNNKSGFNAYPEGYLINEFPSMSWKRKGESTKFWSSNTATTTSGYNEDVANVYTIGGKSVIFTAERKLGGLSVRFVRDASTASTNDYSNSITIYPNPTSSIINIEQDFTTAKVYDISGRELLKSKSKTIDLSELSSGIYLLRLYDNSNKVLGTSKVVKQ